MADKRSCNRANSAGWLHVQAWQGRAGAGRCKSATWTMRGAGRSASPTVGVRGEGGEEHVCLHMHGLSPALAQRLKVLSHRIA